MSWSAECFPHSRTQTRELLERLGGVEEGEAIIRLVHMTALARKGDMPAAREAAAEANARLRERAERIANPAWRRSFLEDVPEHARTLELTAQWFDEAQRGEGTSATQASRTLLGIGGRKATPGGRPRS